MEGTSYVNRSTRILKVASALDIFGGSLVKFEELVAFNQQSTQ